MQQKSQWDFPPAISQTLKYTLLTDPPNQTRILRIVPASFDQELVCSLEIINLADDVVPEYHALSYVWGSTEADLRNVVVNGQMFTVTYNQDQALRHLRQVGITNVWMDAISIDQSNVIERTAQMIVMHSIYSKARQVNIWLGKYDKIQSLLVNFDDTIRQLEHFLVPFWERRLVHEGGSYHQPALALPVIESSEDVLEATVRCAEALCDLPLWKLQAGRIKPVDVPFYTIHTDASSNKPRLTLRKDWFRACYLLDWVFQSDWWSRVWVVQEAVSSRNDPMLWIGKHSIPLQKAMSIARTVFEYGSSGLDNEIAIRMFAELAYKSWNQKHLINTIAGMIQSVRNGSPEGTLLYNVSRARTTTDPRDHVFGMLGLIDHKLVEILKKSPVTTVNEFSKHIGAYDVRNAFAMGSHMIHDLQAPRHKLTTLNFAVGVSPERLMTHNLCSWSLDWSFQGQRMIDIPGTAPFNTCRDTDATSEECIRRAQTHFVISACPVGIVDRVSLSSVRNFDRDENTAELSMATLRRWWDFINTCTKESRRRKSLLEIQTTFWQTVMANDTVHISSLPGVRSAEKLTEDNIHLLHKSWDLLTTHMDVYKQDQLEKDEGKRTAKYQELHDLHGMMQLACDDKAVFHFRPFKPSMFTRQNSFLGRGRIDIQPGDIVCVMKGCFAPVVLRIPRPWLFLHSEQIPEYEFVSAAYVDGVMDGEAVNDRTFWQKLCLV